MIRILGADPGITGALCVYDAATRVYTWRKMSTDGAELDAWLADQVDGETVAYVEELLSIPGDGRQGTVTGSRNHAVLTEALRRTGARIVMVHPKTWQARLGLGAYRGEGRKHHKARMHRLTRPIVIAARGTIEPRKLPLYAADAVLIAEYGRGCEASATTTRTSA